MAKNSKTEIEVKPPILVGQKIAIFIMIFGALAAGLAAGLSLPVKKQVAEKKQKVVKIPDNYVSMGFGIYSEKSDNEKEVKSQQKALDQIQATAGNTEFGELAFIADKWPHNFVVADTDNDNWNEVIIPWVDTVYFYEYRPGNYYIDQNVPNLGANVWDVGDSDNDGKTDVVAQYAHIIKIFESPDKDLHPQTLTWQLDLGSTGGAIVHHSRFTDMDRDGNTEFILTYANIGSSLSYLKVFENNGDNSYVQVADIQLPANTKPGTKAIADFDLDRHLELAVSDGGNIWLYEYTGDYGDNYDLTMVWKGKVPVTGTANSIHEVDDMDQDGNPELVLSGSTYSAVGTHHYVFESDGDNSLAQVFDYDAGHPNAGTNSFMAIGDITGDNREEFVAKEVFDAGYFNNIGDNSYGKIWTTLGINPRWIEIADNNKNNKAEILISQGTSGKRGISIREEGSDVLPSVHLYDLSMIKVDDYRIIQDAIDSAQDGYTIEVDPGIYPAINYSGKDINIKSTEGADKTIIDGWGEGIVVTFENGETVNAILDGFTVTNGFTDFYGGGILLKNNSSPTIKNSVITDNHVTSKGGGIYLEDNSSLTLNDSVIKNNSAFYGGSIYINETASATITGSLLYGNVAGGYGGAIVAKGSGVGNEASATLTNNTIVNNTATDVSGGIWGLVADLELTNNILWGNTATNFTENPNLWHIVGDLSVTYSDVEGGWEGDGNINKDPLFVNPSVGNYHLTKRSPCINAGDPSSPQDPDGTQADMGAYYFHISPKVIEEPDIRELP